LTIFRKVSGVMPWEKLGFTSSAHRLRASFSGKSPDASLSTWETVKNTGFLRKTVAENYGRRSQIAKNLGKSAILAC
jgi:hypothetical protein